MRRGTPLVLGILAVSACRGEPPRSDAGDLARLVDSLRPAVERAAGLTFREPVKAAMRTRSQVRDYLLQQVEENLPPSKLGGIEDTYRLLGLLPDSLRLQDYLVDLLTEQVAGFYDYQTSTLYGVEGYDRTKLTLIVAHELVHALQHQYLPLDSIMRATGDDDRQLAAQSILEGQATLASARVFLPGQQEIPPGAWEQARDAIAAAQSAMPRFAEAPLVLREQLLFPYLSGADFMVWWGASRFADTVPYGPRMPASTEQILQPEHYVDRDEPVTVRFVEPDSARYENTLGDLDLRIFTAHLAGGDRIATRLAQGWGGDRFRLYETPGGPALVAVIVWDRGAPFRQRFRARVERALPRLSRPGYRVALTDLQLDDRDASRLVIAPAGWTRWERLPEARLSR